MRQDVASNKAEHLSSKSSAPEAQYAESVEPSSTSATSQKLISSFRNKIPDLHNASPTEILEMQRLVGNKTVMRMLGKSARTQNTSGSSRQNKGNTQQLIQRGIVDGKGHEQDVEWVLRKLIENEPELYKQCKTHYGDEAGVRQKLESFVTNRDKHWYLSEIYGILRGEISYRQQQQNFVPTLTLPDGTQVQVTISEQTFTPGLETNINPGQRCAINSASMNLAATVAVSGNASSDLRNWEVGFVQTVLTLDRQLVTRDRFGNRITTRSRTNEPTRDGSVTSSDIWFDLESVKSFTRSPFDTQQVRMWDRPGFSWTSGQDDTFVSSSGGERFKTCLVLRENRDNSRVHYLASWEWSTDYDTANNRGIQLGGYSPRADGTNIVLGGAVCKNSIVNDDPIVVGPRPRQAVCPKCTIL